MTKKRYSFESLKRDGPTPEIEQALTDESLALAVQINKVNVAYAEQTGRHLERHAHLYEWSEIVMQAVTVLMAIELTRAVDEAQAREALEHAVANLRMQFEDNIRARQEDGIGTIVKMNDVN